ncbi:ADP-ribosylation factor-like protein 2 [Nematocida minor]|uniref:ADP-ribosylation factor-like protein 2 n=1 Tax=Nematocida minor TaxID=1912983 RepID=UPI002220C442|nr:ADP-ribosylation factor-like protein 2 [Nematocida minor]KAI5192058.1 ADP-ribosylation factor-like protein 2 [Nematocida minor]
MRLSAIVKKVLEKEKRVRIVILGPDNAGKTSLLKAYMNREINDINPTYGYQIVEIKKEINGTTYTIEILDIGGQKSIRAYWDTYYSGADGVLFVYDTYGSEEYKKIIENTISHPTLRDAEFVCASNKVDENMPEDRKIIRVKKHKKEQTVDFDFMKEEDENRKEETEGNKISESFAEAEIEIMYTSAKTGQNVEKAFSTLIKNILERRKKNGILC